MCNRHIVFFFLLDYVNGGELFTHLYQKEQFKETEVRIYIGEIVMALDTLHKVSAIDKILSLKFIKCDSFKSSLLLHLIPVAIL